MPPTRVQEEPSEARIVSELGKEFNVDEVYGAESSFIGILQSVNDVNPVEVPPSCPLKFKENVLEVSDFFHYEQFFYFPVVLQKSDSFKPNTSAAPLSWHVPPAPPEF